MGTVGLDLQTVFLGELLDASLGIDEFPLPSEKWMTPGANLHSYVLPHRTRRERLATRTRHGRLLVVRVNALLHHATSLHMATCRLALGQALGL